MDENAKTNPLSSVAEWCDGVGHAGKEVLYAALVIEEAGELSECISGQDSLVNESAELFEAHARRTSALLRQRGAGLAPKYDALDAALDTAWVALCLAYQLVGNDRGRLAGAWAELHRSNVTDKQVDGVFKRDGTGKILKPPGWAEPNFDQFLNDQR